MVDLRDGGCLSEGQATLHQHGHSIPPSSSGSPVAEASRGLKSPWRAGSRGLHRSGLGQPALLYPGAPSMPAFFLGLSRLPGWGNPSGLWMKQSMLTQTLAEPQCSLQPAVAVMELGKGPRWRLPYIQFLALG